MLGFLERLVLRPDDLEPRDAEAVLAAGVSEQALRDAIEVGALFSMIVRLADALGWEVPGPERDRLRAPAMLAGGYALEDVGSAP